MTSGHYKRAFRSDVFMDLKPFGINARRIVSGLNNPSYIQVPTLNIFDKLSVHNESCGFPDINRSTNKKQARYPYVGICEKQLTFTHISKK